MAAAALVSRYLELLATALCGDDGEQQLDAAQHRLALSVPPGAEGAAETRHCQASVCYRDPHTTGTAVT